MITIIDSIMGSGKTTYMIDYMSLHYSESALSPTVKLPSYLYVAPSLSEVKRVKEACPLLDFRDPQQVGGRKLNHLLQLIVQGQNIVTTHTLFKMINREVYEALRSSHYILVIDEELECVRLSQEMTKHDLSIVRDQGLISICTDNGRLAWDETKHADYEGNFDRVKSLTLSGNLILHNNTQLWVFPTEFLLCFEKAYLLTYLFESSPMSSYLKAYGVAYEMKTLNRNSELIPYTTAGHEADIKAKVRELINVYDGKANRWGDTKPKSNPFSSSWCSRMSKTANGKKELSEIKASVANWFKKSCNTPAKANAWTCYQKIEKHLAGERYSKGFIPCNAKGMNDYRHKESLAYLCNVFLNPQIASYLKSKGIEPDNDAFALSEMVQWVWRSRIREGQPINLFVPSERMRTLFLDWLHDRSANRSDLQVAA